MAYRIFQRLCQHLRYDSLLTLLVFVTFVFLLDLLTPLGIEAWGLYMVALWLSGHKPERAPWLVPVTALTSTCLILLAHEFKAPGVPPIYSLGNRMLGIAIGWSASFFLVRAARRKYERDLTQRALHDRDQQIAAVLDNTEALVYMLDRHDRFLLINRRFEKLFHTTSAQLIGKSVDELFVPSVAQACRTSNQQVFQSLQPLEIEEVISQNDGSHTYLSAKVPQFSEDGKVTTVCTIATDITERKRAEEILQQANESLEERVNARTAELLTSREQLKALAVELSRTEERERKRLAAELHDNLAQLLAICKLKLSSIPQDRQELKRIGKVIGLLDEALSYTRSLMAQLHPPLLGDDTDLHVALTWVVDKMRPLGLNVTINDDGCPKILDEELLTITYQATRELLINVLKHGKTNQATVTAERVANTVHVTVSDRGEGFNVSAQNSPSIEAGFGLLNIRQRVESIGGEFHIASTLRGGTHATIVMPLKTIDSNMEVHRSGESSSLSGMSTHLSHVPNPKITILLVDDHPIMRDGLRRMLEQEEDLAVVGEAGDGVMAIEAAKRLHPDIVIMDVNMPKMNGIEATRQIMEALPDVAVIGLSMHEDEKVRRLMIESGAAAYLSKGGSCDGLTDTIRKIAKDKLACNPHFL